MLAVVSTAVFFPHIISFTTPKLAVLIVGAGVAWPIAVAISRGYERSKIGVGGDEMRAVFRAVDPGHRGRRRSVRRHRAARASSRCA